MADNISEVVQNLSSNVSLETTAVLQTTLAIPTKQSFLQILKLVVIKHCSSSYVPVPK